MILQQTALALITAVFLASSSTSTEAQESKNCTRSCGQGKSAKHLPYPFGFSGDCEIRLNCKKGDIEIGGFQVLNITSTSIFINLPAECNRSIDSISHLFGHNYGPSLNNSLLLQNCGSKSPANGCSVPTSFVEKQFFNSKGCGNSSKNDIIRCYSPERHRVELNFTDVQNTNCTFLFSSVTVNSGNSSVSLELQKLELGWWLNGNHTCDPNATTEGIRLPGGKSGLRCHCNDGFHGDGFVGGLGCQKVSECTPSKFLSGQCLGKNEVGIIVAVVIAGASLVAGLFQILLFKEIGDCVVLHCQKVVELLYHLHITVRNHHMIQYCQVLLGNLLR